MTESTTIRFKLIDEALNKDFGTVIFNGKFVFRLKDGIDKKTWDQIGIIPVKGEGRVTEAKDLFYYLNERLPINLRDASTEEKLEYMKKSGLRVASDNFKLEPV